MADWLTEDNIKAFFAVLGGLYALALVIVKLTPTPKDNEALAEVSVVLRAIARLFGLNLTQGRNTKPGEKEKPYTGPYKLGVILFSLLLLAGCAGLVNMTPQERALTLCDDFITQYEAMHAESLRLLASEQVSTERKKYIATVINPRLNQLKPVISDYCRMAIKGGTPNAAAITAILSDISALFMEVRQ